MSASLYGIIDEEGRKREVGFTIKINESDTQDMNGNTIHVEYISYKLLWIPLNFYNVPCLSFVMLQISHKYVYIHIFIMRYTLYEKSFDLHLFLYNNSASIAT